MVKIRLTRTGASRQPSYRIVVCDERVKRDGKFIEIIGFHNPFLPKTEIDKKRLEYWIGEGAQMTEAVKRLLKE